MAKTIVDSTGRMRTIVDSRQQQLGKQYDLMEVALRQGEVHFTKTTLARDYGLTRPEVWAFVKLMDAREVLATDPPVNRKIGNRTVFSETSWHIVDRPVPGQQRAPYYGSAPVFPGKTPSRSDRRRLAMRGCVCDRCGSVIPGKGRHRKSTRGHTRDKCDLAMVKVIHEQ
jgi:hypothetical protein